MYPISPRRRQATLPAVILSAAKDLSPGSVQFLRCAQDDRTVHAFTPLGLAPVLATAGLYPPIYYLDIKYTLTIIIIPPAMVVGNI